MGATNDGGCGACLALGVIFRNESGEILSPKTNSSERDSSNRQSRNEVPRCHHLVNDVDNPLYGENGQTYIYSPQKVILALMATMEKQMIRYSKVISDFIGDIYQAPSKWSWSGRRCYLRCSHF